jgi:hypothetical protein
MAVDTGTRSTRYGPGVQAHSLQHLAIRQAAFHVNASPVGYGIALGIGVDTGLCQRWQGQQQRGE